MVNFRGAGSLEKRVDASNALALLEIEAGTKSYKHEDT